MALPRILLKRGYDYLQRKFRETVVLHSVATETTNSHGQKVTTFSEETLKAIVYSTRDNISNQPFSELQVGDYIFLFKSDVTVNRHDLVEYSGDYYKVDKVEPLPTKGGSVGTVAYCILGKAP